MRVTAQHSVDLITFQDQSTQIESLQRDKEQMSEDVASLHSQIDYLRKSTTDREVVTRLDAKIRDLEAKLDLEQISHARAEVTRHCPDNILKWKATIHAHTCKYFTAIVQISHC